MTSPLAPAERAVATLRLERRLRRMRDVRRTPPERPIGVKLELTHRCNLRCAFCYTDSPRRTLERTPDLPDADWRRIVDEAIGLGVIEAVVTGGEPLLRRDLTLELVGRLGESGVGVTLNTNGWFVDEETAARLAAIPGLRVHVSVDGATPEIHDAARGVPGSWRRATRAIALLLDRGATVQAVHVVTPENQSSVETFLDHMRILGVRTLQLAPVSPVGAAAGSGDWTVSERRLRKIVTRFNAAARGETAARLVSETAAVQSIRANTPPAALLVRPLGAVLTDSLHPFAYGNVRNQSLAECWDAMVENWRAPEVTAWAARIRTTQALAEADLVPYRDVEVPVGASAAAPPDRTGGGREPSRNAQRGHADVAAAREQIARLALERRYRLAPIRWSGDRDGDRVVRVIATGHTTRLNRTTAAVMDALDQGMPLEAVEQLSRRYPEVSAERLEGDVLAAVRLLTARGIAVAAAAGSASPSPMAGSVSELPGAAVA